jgi:hypothetical protein
VERVPDKVVDDRVRLHEFLQLPDELTDLGAEALMLFGAACLGGAMRQVRRIGFISAEARMASGPTILAAFLSGISTPPGLFLRYARQRLSTRDRCAIKRYSIACVSAVIEHTPFC